MSPQEWKLVQGANRLLAFTMGVAFLALITVTALFGPPGYELRTVAIGAGVVVAYLLINRGLLKRRVAPLIRPEAPVTLVLAGLLPLILLACGAAAMLFPGQDFGLAVIVGGVLFGLTLESALARPDRISSE